MRRLISAITLAAACLCTCAADNDGEIKIPEKYIPTVHGTFRAFYEHSTATGQSRFMVRNARLSAAGKVLPMADYFFQVDLCDRGKIKILDAYIGLIPLDGLKIMAGQCRVPFSVGASRIPAQYHFANRATMCKLYGNLRSAGVKIGYRLPHTPLYIEAGAFNGTDMTDHTPWNSHLTYSAKANYTLGCGLVPQICFMSRLPGADGVRINQADASLTFQHGNWFAEAEYCYRHYTGNSHTPSHGYNIMVDYGFPIRTRLANRLSFQGRFYGITDAASGLRDASGQLATLYWAHRRATAGITASYIAQPVHCDFRLNYEQYFYSHPHKVSPSDNNRLVAALILYF